MNQEQSTAVFLWLNEYILNHHMHIPLRADDRKILQTPVLFESYRDMAEAVLRVILTGRLDGSGVQPPAVSAVRRGVDNKMCTRRTLMRHTKIFKITSILCC